MIINGINVPDRDSPCQSWIDYHKSLQKKFGKQNANVNWLKSWQYDGSSTCKTNSDFTKYFAKNNIDISDPFTSGFASITDIGSNILGLTENITKTLRIVVPIVLVGTVALVGYFLFKVARDTSGGQAASLATTVATRGSVSPQPQINEE